MRRFEREVLEDALINEMLKMYDIAFLGLNDGDFPYVVPMTFGYEMNEEGLDVYLHSATQGHKVQLMQADPHVALAFALYHDFPDRKYKGHYHDYRSVMAKGTLSFIDPQSDYETYKKGFGLLYTCNHRDIKPLDPEHLPHMYMIKVHCKRTDVTAKAEFPIRTKEDVPFLDVYALEPDSTPFDLSDIIKERRLEND